MNPLEQLALGAHALGRAARLLGRGALWAPLALLGVAEAAVLAALAGVAHPALSWALAGWVARAGGERALHYPDAFRTLPALYARADGLLGWLVGSLAVGALTHGCVARFLGAPVPARASLGAALRRWPALALAVLPAHLLAAGLSVEAEAMAHARGIVALAVTTVAPFGLGLVRWLALFLPVLVMRGGESAPRALASLPRAWARGLLATVAPSLVVMPLLWGIGLVAGDPALLVDRGTPELVVAAVAARAFAGLLATFVLTAATALAYLGAVEGPA